MLAKEGKHQVECSSMVSYQSFEIKDSDYNKLCPHRFISRLHNWYIPRIVGTNWISLSHIFSNHGWRFLSQNGEIQELPAIELVFSNVGLNSRLVHCHGAVE